jgi:hypothetical protein
MCRRLASVGQLAWCASLELSGMHSGRAQSCMQPSFRMMLEKASSCKPTSTCVRLTGQPEPGRAAADVSYAQVSAWRRLHRDGGPSRPASLAICTAPRPSRAAPLLQPRTAHAPLTLGGASAGCRACTAGCWALGRRRVSQPATARPGCPPWPAAPSCALAPTPTPSSSPGAWWAPGWLHWLRNTDQHAKVKSFR